MNWKRILAVYGLAGIAASFGLVISFAIFLVRYYNLIGVPVGLLFLVLCFLAWPYALLIRKYRERFHI